ncbi:hypothetical protein STPYR_11006 [uncultured Stenotrophomonas sp.]|uniref:Uncharacterized protein n=1 Tax=uncultured Stenotrophomonas sp. TaxID=165438 RepID=A0A1Y5Q5B9_9GAMM|nr:hypothetical protein STPYR_11006 [uncultured Stenotrophomonas sp.]
MGLSRQGPIATCVAPMPAQKNSGAVAWATAPLPYGDTAPEGASRGRINFALKPNDMLPLLVSAAVLWLLPPPHCTQYRSGELPVPTPNQESESWHKSSTPTSCRSMLSAT